MKNKLSLFVVAISLLASSCNNTAKPVDDKKVLADTLYNHVMKGHDVGMAKTPNLSKMMQAVQRAVDSIERLPADARAAAATYKEKLVALGQELKSADDAMTKWMADFSIDSAKNDLDARIKYLSSEKIKVTKVKEAILNSLAKADSLVKKKL